MLQGPYGKQHQPYNRRQGHHHQPVRPRVLHTEEVGEAYRRYTTEDQDGPQDPGYAFFGCDQAHPSCVGQSLDLIESFRVELLVGPRLWLKLLKVRPDLVDKGPPR